MKIFQAQYVKDQGWDKALVDDNYKQAQLVIVFGSRELLENQQLVDAIKGAYPNAYLLGGSTAGEITGNVVNDNTLTITAVLFEFTKICGASLRVDNPEHSEAAGQALAKKINHEGLRHIIVISDGLHVNGSDLVKGLVNNVPSHVTITGGLAGDGVNFKETLVLADGKAQSNYVSIVGLYGERIKVGYGSMGGWDSFGPERVITSAKGNVLYELDGKPALDLYKKYLGEHANGLPATGLLFPLCVRIKEGNEPVVRTILSINEQEKSITFAGNVTQGALAKLMKANFDRLIDGAVGAAQKSYTGIGSIPADLAILISCVGRKVILKQRVEEEVEGVRDILGNKTVFTGFYSYGEISPFVVGASCELHNQTMTITTLSE